MAQLHTYVQKRLAAWAIWRLWGSSGKPARVVSWYEKVVMAPNVQGRGKNHEPCPVNETEAYELEQCVIALAPYLRDTILMEWTRAGTAEYKAKWLGVSRSTYFERQSVAEDKILGYLNDQAAGVALPKHLPDPKRAKNRNGKKGLTIPDCLRTFAGTMA